MGGARRVLIDGRGGISSIKVVEAETRAPEPDEVRIRTLASGIGFADVMAAHGGYPLAPRGTFTPGYDLAGRVEACGADVADLEEGRLVVALNPQFGCQADAVCMKAELVVPVNEDADPAQAVALVLNYLTAHCLVHRKADLTGGETVLVHAAAGGVGTALLQLGRRLNLTMYGTASRAKHDVVRELGGIPIDYRSEDFVEVIRREHPHGIDAAFDPFGGENLRRSYDVVGRGGRVVSYGFAGDSFGGRAEMIKGLLRMAWLNAWPDGKRVSLCATPDEVRKNNAWYRETLSGLVRMLEAGEVQPVIGARVPLAEAAEGYRRVAEGSVTGKVVLIH
ncbi:zinc-binding dehydrogenase [Aquisalimonas lutea]|uniref:zinc-binding dehydrogenase n=1 Tax=Aquisalimonas lutea TaxID=1327750 RepID=UPI0025B43F4F|nr:zinc-binding dehydrogenase [Aquisalimonas lutea]MDN3519403.1 zinc-binding dehydrogenase [Aquisalimonas lutea]